MLPIATGGTRIGMIMIVRSTPLPRVMPATSSASPSPRTISAATATATKISVLTIVACSPGSLSSADQLRCGVNDQISAPPWNWIVDTLIRKRLTIGYAVSAANTSTAGSRLQCRNVALSQSTRLVLLPEGAMVRTALMSRDASADARSRAGIEQMHVLGRDRQPDRIADAGPAVTVE